MLLPEDARAVINKAIAETHVPEEPHKLYDPVSYFMSMGGKRIRPVLSLMAASLFTDDTARCVAPALAMEVFHNFTLVHDDVMDEADLRRGKETIHSKWDLNTAILSGDLLMIRAVDLLASAPPSVLPEVMNLFSRTAEEVCVGQQMDMDFEQLERVGMARYLEMIRLKTSVLLGCSLQTGALCGGSDADSANDLYTFGEQLGIAFQIMDDLLDAFPPDDRFGKKPGGDILRKKKTFLFVRTLEKLDEQKTGNFLSLYNGDSADKVEQVIQVMKENDIHREASLAMDAHFLRAMEALDRIEARGKDTAGLRVLGEQIMMRSH
jgi:geranylgeranyl diphosphate synthase type II